MESGNDLFKVKDEYLFTFGGASTFEVLDVARQIWRQFQPSGIQDERLSVIGARVAQFQSKIFILGGQDSVGQLLDDVLEFSCENHSIALAADWRLPEPIQDFALA